MKWITWFNIKSGNRTTRAHLVSDFLAGRTECGWPISTLTANAPRATLRCQACLKAIENKKGGEYERANQRQGHA